GRGQVAPERRRGQERPAVPPAERPRHPAPLGCQRGEAECRVPAGIPQITSQELVAAMDSIFRWETLREARPHTLDYKEPVRGRVFEVELTSGPVVEVFRADDGHFYFCHGLTFGGTEAPGGAVSPFSGKPVQIILANHYTLVAPEAGAVAGDVLVWRG